MEKKDIYFNCDNERGQQVGGEDMLLRNLKKIRNELKISQTKLAREVGVSLMSIQLWENGGTTPNEENMLKLRRALEKLRQIQNISSIQEGK